MFDILISPLIVLADIIRVLIVLTIFAAFSFYLIFWVWLARAMSRTDHPEPSYDYI